MRSASPWLALLAAAGFALLATLSCARAGDSNATLVTSGEESTAAHRSVASDRRRIVILRQWKGRRPLGTDPIQIPYVTDRPTLARVWEDWGVPEPLPPIDFEREVALTLIVRSGLVMFLDPTIDGEGNLSRNAVATPDYPAHWSYIIAIVTREGVRSIDGQPI